MFEQPKFKIVYSEEVIDFLNSLNEKVKEKIIFNINKSKYVIDNDLFKKLKGSDIWEFRTKYSGSIYRIFGAMGISASFEMTGIGKVALW